MESFRLEKAFKAESNHISVAVSCFTLSNAAKKNLKEKFWDISIARVQIKYFTVISSNLCAPKNQITAIRVTLTTDSCGLVPIWLFFPQNSCTPKAWKEILLEYFEVEKAS